MAAKAGEKSVVGVEGLIQVNSRHRPGGTRQHSVFFGKEQRWSVIPFGYPCCGNTYDAGVPVRGFEHYGAAFCKIQLFHHLRCGSYYVPLLRLTAAVQLVQKLGYLLSLLGIMGAEQFHAYTGVLHSARGVEPRPEAEGEVPGYECIALVVHYAAQRLYALAAIALVYHIQRHGDYCPVFAQQRHHVCHRGYACLREIAFGGFPAYKALRKLPRYARAAYVAVRVFIVLPGMAHHGAAVRYSAVTAVMIRHHHVHSQLPASVYLAVCLYAVIHGNYELYAHFVQPLHGRNVKAVALVVPRWYIVYHICTHTLEAVVKYGGGAYAVRVVVAVYAYLFASYSPLYALQRLIHILHEKRIQKLPLPRVQEKLHSLPVTRPAGVQKRSKPRRYPLGLGYIVIYL